ncbi:MAG: Cupin 2, conserved barrel domain protein [Microgenomates group bacterium GW2011_GWC1_43_11]|uniref:Cupin 2, conserved barrel domain protein n=2 Tax=Candidatus Gottesmaniibacteriota TaxID=1752720 RepID=A0A0G1JMG8_9BACT|nr:MAG: Cupin 2, conserved barrel domain protein [Microgenomates group bacterium GW2011_GWC1_43_11]KKT36619.1 MAG: Cupin 2, conserved barrel domain protein [Candidatus Gottesmanbacteria bacterium GW2011_GWB1_44_11c]HCM81795.1 cupin domain-containing protein [Patescibacteria group bacterium]
MIGYVGPIEQLTQTNTNFRQVIFTGPYCQLVVMSLLPNEEIGLETHVNLDQFFRIEEGEGKVVMNGEEQTFKAGDAIIVPAGTNHNVINTSPDKPLKLYTIYTPPNHPDGKIHKTKAEAMADEKDHV